ncbi:CLUMA_CG017792, isoform A [Clunio marinus]|uniref:CLUMA_CG017792, isoform A n=1 Tax=Clunio marinus TaxID=568069 RepID=A0A1J1IYV2_9DIPT|nr:CLUMA_CG017792, isoform A [Clunio marinus]
MVFGPMYRRDERESIKNNTLANKFLVHLDPTVFIPALTRLCIYVPSHLSSQENNQFGVWKWLTL